MELVYKVVKNIAVLSTSSSGWVKELNLVSWNNAPAKYDVRDWNPESGKLSKGVTLTEAEARALYEALREELE